MMKQGSTCCSVIFTKFQRRSQRSSPCKEKMWHFVWDPERWRWARLEQGWLHAEALGNAWVKPQAKILGQNQARCPRQRRQRRVAAALCGCSSADFPTYRTAHPRGVEGSASAPGSGHRESLLTLNRRAAGANCATGAQTVSDRLGR